MRFFVVHLVNLLRLLGGGAYLYSIYLMWTSTTTPPMLFAFRLTTTLVFFLLGMSLLASIRYENPRH